jgi:hypothetical protein
MSQRLRRGQDPDLYEQLRNQVLRRDVWSCQTCGAMSDLEVHHQKFRSQAGDDSEQNLVTVCAACHAKYIMVDRSGERAAASDRLETDIFPSEPTSDTEEEMVSMQPTRLMRLSSERC